MIEVRISKGQTGPLLTKRAAKTAKGAIKFMLGELFDRLVTRDVEKRYNRLEMYRDNSILVHVMVHGHNMTEEDHDKIAEAVDELTTKVQIAHVLERRMRTAVADERDVEEQWHRDEILDSDYYVARAKYDFLCGIWGELIGSSIQYPTREEIERDEEKRDG